MNNIGKCSAADFRILIGFWSLLGHIAMQELLRRLDLLNLSHASVHLGLRLLLGVVLFALGLWLAARAANLMRRALKRARVEPTLIPFLRNSLYSALIVLVAVSVLGFLGVPTASLVTAVGAAGLAIGLALQGSLSNLAWGVLLILFRPFRTGDWVDAGGYSGSVEAISLMHTTLVLADNRVAVIPNAKVGADAIVNYNRRGTRRAEVQVGIGYGDDVERALQVLRDMLAADARVLSDPAPTVYVAALGDSSVNLTLWAWAQRADWWPLQRDLPRRVKETMDAAGISMPFPQRELLIRRAPVTPRAD
jgi:small conductance mechanosensitive channel